MIEMLKKGKQEPRLEQAMGRVDGDYLTGRKYDVERVDILLTMPGVTVDNVYGIVRRIKKVCDICSWSKLQMEEVMTPYDADMLFRFLHTPFNSSWTCLFEPLQILGEFLPIIHYFADVSVVP